MKRFIDIVLSGLALIILSPLLIPIAIILKLTGEGEIFYIQPRVGKAGQLFGLIKFATMLKDSPNLPGGDVTLANDPRVLPVGRFLRKTKINELPQLWNILKGDMSIVGPRPLTPRNFEFYSKKIQEKVITMPPGLTGIGSIVFRDEESIIASSPKTATLCYQEDIAPFKGELELWYKNNQSFWLDLLLMLLTAWVVIAPGSRFYENYLKGLPERPRNLGMGIQLKGITGKALGE